MRTVRHNEADTQQAVFHPNGDIVLLVVDPCRCDYQEIEQACSMQHASVQVFSADSLSAAIHLLRQTSFDLCVVNLSLQNSDGPSLLWRIQSAQPGMPIVAVADSYDSHLEQAAWCHGTTAFVAKPEHQPWLRCWLQEHSPKRQRARFTSESTPDQAEVLDKTQGRHIEQLVPI